MIFTGMDGELRIIERGGYGGMPISKSTTHYLEILFCNMDLSCPVERPRTEERVIMNRGTFDNDTHYVEGMDDVTLAPMALTFSCMIDDKNYSTTLSDWLTGEGEALGGTSVYCTAQAGVTRIYSWDGITLISSVSLPTFADSKKQSYKVEVKYDSTSGSDIGYTFDEVYFPPDQQTITEAEDGLTLSANALVYGGTSRITAFTAGYTSIVSN